MRERRSTPNSLPAPELSVWTRRCLSISVHLAVSAILLPLAPLLLSSALLLDFLRGEVSRRPRVRALGFFLVYLASEVVGIFAATFVWMRLLGGRLGTDRAYLEANARLQRWWTSAFLETSLRLFSIRMRVEGESNLEPAPFLLFVRHSSTADTVLPAVFLGARRRLLPRYVLKVELLWDPCLDLVGSRMPNAFISRADRGTGQDVQAIAALARDLDDRSVVVLYPEGTRFSRDKLRRAIEALRTSGHAELAELASSFQFVLPPKLGGAIALMEAAPHLDIVFLEHVGFEGAASFSQFWGGALIGRELRVRFRRFAAAEIPSAHRARWLFERWHELDRWVGENLDRTTTP